MVEIPAVKKISIDKITTDGNNPNVMDINQQIALKNNIKKYGFLVPIITNKDYLVADGEHRLQAAKDLGMTDVPVVALKVKEVDRRLLRQVMNKLKGVHDLVKDAEEYQYLLESKEIDFAKLLAHTDEEVLNKINMFEGVDVAKAFAEKEYDDNIPTTTECPKCEYTW